MMYERVIPTDITYTFNVSESTSIDYKFSASIIAWITENLTNLTDTDNHCVFSKVNNGFNEETLRSFGNKPVCDIYFKNTQYNTDFDVNSPQTVNTIILCYLKGANNHTYMKACELHDFLLQEFSENRSFRVLPDIVIDTLITNSEVRPEIINKKYGVMVVFELTHNLY